MLFSIGSVLRESALNGALLYSIRSNSGSLTNALDHQETENISNGSKNDEDGKVGQAKLPHGFQDVVLASVGLDVSCEIHGNGDQKNMLAMEVCHVNWRKVIAF